MYSSILLDFDLIVEDEFAKFFTGFPADQELTVGMSEYFPIGCDKNILDTRTTTEEND